MAKSKAKAVPARRKARAESKSAQTDIKLEVDAPGIPPGDEPHEVAFPVVAVGASAGGLAAFTELLKALPARSGMAFVLIQHLEPRHESLLTLLLSKATSMPVIEVSNGIAVEPNHVYVIPPNRSMTIQQGTLRLAPRRTGAALQRPIDDFAIALGQEKGNAAIGVVLSGTGSDGTNGLKAIKTAGGVTFAQDPKSAQWPAMPMSAISAGAVDFVLSPKQIAAELARIGQHPYLKDEKEVPDGSDLDKISLLLRSSVGVDFRLYKQATVRRRIARRMALQKIESLAQYAQILRKNRDEAQALADDIFIHVTSFFRDEECFLALRKRVLAKLRSRKPADEAVRIWVPGCSTGEEVYSIAMLLIEELGEQASRMKIQVFGTDIQESAVGHARAGIYTEAAVSGLSAARLRRFLTKADHGYQIQKFVRDLCVFARHDLAKDPPFSRLDLISCRNVLIYMGPTLQKKVLSVFQYALKPGGFLFLGNSESISEYSDIFIADDRKHRIFQRKPSSAVLHELGQDPGVFREIHSAAPKVVTNNGGTDFRRDAEGILLEHFTPPALIVDPDLHIVHFQGDTSPYLAPATGQPSFHLLKMVRPELVIDLRTAIFKARRDGVPVPKEAVQFEYEGHPAAVRLEVRPLHKAGGRKDRKTDLLLVVFEKAEPASFDNEPRGGTAGRGKRAAEHSDRRERELATAREHLRTLIAEHETAQEEMKAANEEILSSNEELQSTNEELETAKEELQSSNEELITLNEELQHRNAELNVLTHDLSNLLLGVDIPVLVLDGSLRVRRFTPVAGKLLNLIASDVGRPFSNIASNLEVGDWTELLSKVTEQGQTVEREVSDRSGHLYSMRVRPYKAEDNRIEGVLVVLLDTDAVARSRDAAQRAGDYARAIVETTHEALVVIDSDFCVASVNRSFCDLFGVSHEAIEKQPFFGTGPGQCSDTRLREILRDVFAKHTEIKDVELDQQFALIGHRHLRLNARPIVTSGTVLIAIEDVTDRRRAQQELARSESTIRALVESAPQSVIAVNADGIIALANGNTESMFGYRREELIGHPLELLVPEEAKGRQIAHHLRNFAAAQNGASGLSLNMEGRRKDGAAFPAEIALSAIDTASGKLGVAFITDITERKRLAQIAQTHSTQVEALAANLLSAQEDERRRVSRELHDQICQQLASLAIDMGGLVADLPPPGEARNRLKSLQARVVKASEEARHIAYELHPSVLDDLGLVASLRALCNALPARVKDISVKFASSVLPAAISREVLSSLYRVAQESLENVIKHAGAKHVSVTLATRKGLVMLTVEDDGRGFDVESVRGKGGLGLIGMKERTRLVNGKLTIAPRSGGGTRIVLQVPLQAAVL